MRIVCAGVSHSYGRTTRRLPVRARLRPPAQAPVTALAGVDVTVSPGECVALTGPSGSGKSTLLHLMGGLEVAEAGTIEVDGHDLRELSTRERAAFRRTVGFVFQRYHLISTLSVLDNVIAPVLPERTTYDKAARARELLSAVGLAGRARTSPARLSGGEQQRVAIARALMCEPGLILADEPTGNLDSRTGDDVMELILGVARERGATLLIATHDAEVAARCGRVISLLDGTIAEDVSLDEPADPAHTLGLIGRPGA
ncbi:MAG: ABC transporter ATP-binding protein [Nocardioides sp.]